MIKIKNLQVILGGEVVLRDINFEVNDGDVVAILGPNGAGKTVLLKTLLGLFPYEGKITWKKGVKVGYVPQRVPFVKDLPLSVEDFFRLKNVSGKKISDILRAVGFEDDNILQKEVGKISSGQFQRVLIAWSLVDNPKILLFDEPTAGIDVGGIKSVYQLLDKLRKERGLTIILVTHDLDAAHHMATKVICLGTKSTCYNKHHQHYHG